jgi:hypothetical protein
LPPMIMCAISFVGFANGYKRDAAAMPRPILLRPNTYEWNGVPVPPPSTWASFRVNLGAAEFDVEVEPLDISEVTVRPTPVIRK